jgi:hypothetical protein
MENLNAFSDRAAVQRETQDRAPSRHIVRVTLPDVETVVLSQVTAADIQRLEVRLYPISFLLDALPLR